MVDYSRWDALEVSDDEDDDRRARPQVTKLEGPTTIELGHGRPRKAAPVPAPPRIVEVAEAPAAPPAAPPAAAAPAVDAASPEEHVARITANGGRANEYFWSQTKATVTAHFLVPAGTRARDVRLSVGEEGEVAVRVGGQAAVEGRLRHRVKAPEDDLELDWELVDLPGLDSRLVRVTVDKEAPQGVALWWDSLLQGGPTIDVGSLQGRDAAGQRSFAEAWEEAHRIFQEKVKNHKPVLLDPSPEEP